MLKFLFLAIVISLQVIAHDKVIYGDDDRISPVFSQNRIINLYSRSVALRVSKTDLQLNKNGLYQFTGLLTLGERENLCKDQAFYDDYALGDCSGFLIEDDKIMTAGHCVLNQKNCDRYLWILNYKNPRIKEQIEKQQISPQDVYHCKEIIITKHSNRELHDFAVIKLDRPSKEESLPLAYEDEVSSLKIDSEVLSLSHPSGIAQKLSVGKLLKKEKGFLFASVDTFSSSSGSPLISPDDYNVYGVLVGGETDYVKDPIEGCYRVNKCIDCPGERYLGLDIIRSFLPDLP